MNIMVSSRKKVRISLDISSHINETTSKKIVRKVKSTSIFCVGIADSTDEKIKLYIAESLRMNATFTRLMLLLRYMVCFLKMI